MTSWQGVNNISYGKNFNCSSSQMLEGMDYAASMEKEAMRYRGMVMY